MARRTGSAGRFVLPLILILGATSCSDVSQTSMGQSALPLRLTPLRIQAATDADSLAAWALFDRDTGTRWFPESGADLTLDLDTARPLAYMKVFGPAAGSLELRTEAGSQLAAP